MPDEPGSMSMPNPPPLVDFGWLTSHQYAHLLTVVEQLDGMAVITSLCVTIRSRVDECRKCGLRRLAPCDRLWPALAAGILDLNPTCCH